jgi:20S proteasome alpha/beta subunit
MTKDEALKLALEALKEITRRNQSDHQAEIAEEAIAAIKVAPEAPQRTWVGLTDEEIAQMGLNNYRQVVRETEAKLKAKNS